LSIHTWVCAKRVSLHVSLSYICGSRLPT